MFLAYLSFFKILVVNQAAAMSFIGSITKNGLMPNSHAFSAPKKLVKTRQPNKKMIKEPNIATTILFSKPLVKPRSAKRPVKLAAGKKAIKYPAVGPKNTGNPNEKLANTGKPNAPSIKYDKVVYVANRHPKLKPIKITVAL